MISMLTAHVSNMLAHTKKRIEKEQHNALQYLIAISANLMKVDELNTQRAM